MRGLIAHIFPIFLVFSVLPDQNLDYDLLMEVIKLTAQTSQNPSQISDFTPDLGPDMAEVITIDNLYGKAQEIEIICEPYSNTLLGGRCEYWSPEAGNWVFFEY